MKKTIYPCCLGTLAVLLGTGLSLSPAVLCAQQAPPVAAAAEADAPEISQQEVTPTFRVRSSQVLVRVVVRDSNGKPVSGLKPEDFKLFDNGTLQSIASFREERAGQLPAALVHEAQPGETPAARAGEIPSRFLLFLFDEMHLSPTTYSRAVASAQKVIDHSLAPADRVAIFTSSGLVQQDYTSDRDALHAALSRIQPGAIKRESESTCPYMNYYFANLIDNLQDATAISVAIQQTVACERISNMPGAARMAQQEVAATAQRIRSEAEMDRKVFLSVLKDAVQRSSGNVGERSILLLSDGFFLDEAHQELTPILERALQNRVVINVLDARGLWTDPAYDSSVSGFIPELGRYMHESETTRSESPSELADATGGIFFHNNNDLDAGMRLLAAPPESSYMLSFAPSALKSDGRFHKIDVKLDHSLKYQLTARKGYFAPRKVTDPELAARQEIEDTVFSQEELHEIPLQIHTQFFKPSPETARLSVIARIGMASLHFRQEKERHMDTLTEVCAAFDHNGRYVTGVQKQIDLRLRPATLDALHSGISVKSNLDLKPGAYLVRVVLRDREGQMLSASSVTVDIP